MPSNIFSNLTEHFRSGRETELPFAPLEDIELAPVQTPMLVPGCTHQTVDDQYVDCLWKCCTRSTTLLVFAISYMVQQVILYGDAINTIPYIFLMYMIPISIIFVCDLLRYKKFEDLVERNMKVARAFLVSWSLIYTIVSLKSLSAVINMTDSPPHYLVILIILPYILGGLLGRWNKFLGVLKHFIWLLIAIVLGIIISYITILTSTPYIAFWVLDMGVIFESVFLLTEAYFHKRSVRITQIKLAVMAISSIYGMSNMIAFIYTPAVIVHTL